jgi:hypothetical protein
MEDINDLIFKKIKNIIKKSEIDNYVDYKKIINNKFNNNFIDNYVKDIYNDDYDSILEKTTQLCSLTYYQKIYTENIFKNVHIIYSKDYDKSKYYITYNKKHNNIIVAFRGTNYVSNVISGIQYYRTNFDFISENEKDKFITWRNKNIYNNKYFDPLTVPLKDDIDIEIHKGYYNVSVIMLQQLMDDLFKIIKNQKTNIVFVGHSMGIIGNIISLLFKIKLEQYKILENNLNKIKIFNVTVNAPTIGNKNYNLLKFYYGIEKTIQFYNYQDKLINYGYHDTFFDKKKIRHTEYMLKGINAEINKKFYINLNYGKNLEEIYRKLKDDNKIVNKILFYHSFFKIDGNKKLLYI